jgi:hypothetical protein
MTRSAEDSDSGDALHNTVTNAIDKLQYMVLTLHSCLLGLGVSETPNAEHEDDSSTGSSEHSNRRQRSDTRADRGNSRLRFVAFTLRSIAYSLDKAGFPSILIGAEKLGAKRRYPPQDRKKREEEILYRTTDGEYILTQSLEYEPSVMGYSAPVFSFLTFTEEQAQEWLEEANSQDK